jgi:hypothetical protein
MPMPSRRVLVGALLGTSEVVAGAVCHRAFAIVSVQFERQLGTGIAITNSVLYHPVCLRLL